MAYMTGQQLAQLFRQLVDDPDETFFTTADVANALALGYNEYVTYVGTQIPSMYERKYDFTLNGTGELELDGILFGAAPTQGTNAYRITKLHTTNPGQFPDFGYWLPPCDTMEQLWSVGSMGGNNVYNQSKWMLQGTKILFSAQLTGTFRLYYLPTPTVDWATAIAAPGVFIDNTSPYQQIIAYWAVQAYAIRDWAQNPALEQKFRQLLQELDKWLVRGRAGDAHRWVQPGRQRNSIGSQGGW